MNINWYPGHMAKTKRLIKEKYPLLDVVYELVDSRIPASSKMVGIEELVKNKPRLLIMTKCDLCDVTETEKWAKKYEQQGYRVLMVDLKNSVDIKKIIDVTNEMVEDLRAKRVEKGIQKKDIRVLVVGVPNVGKSTLINKMVGKKVAKVENKPGVTKSINWLKTKSNILLLDTPGILWPKFDNNLIGLNLASMTAIKSEILPIDEVAVHILNMLNDHYPNILKQRYKMDKLPEDIVEAYEIIGKNQGCIISGGEIDYDRVSQIIINDIKDEKIKGITFDRM